MCVARYASHYFSKGAICVPLDDQEKNICILSLHRATRELYAKVPSHRAPVGALCEGSMRIELRSELYAKGALCGSTELCAYHWTTRKKMYVPFLRIELPGSLMRRCLLCEGSSMRLYNATCR